jgi:hypothetical protein
MCHVALNSMLAMGDMEWADIYVLRYNTGKPNCTIIVQKKENISL